MASTRDKLRNRLKAERPRSPYESLFDGNDVTDISKDVSKKNDRTKSTVTTDSKSGIDSRVNSSFSSKVEFNNDGNDNFSSNADTTARVNSGSNTDADTNNDSDASVSVGSVTNTKSDYNVDIDPKADMDTESSDGPSIDSSLDISSDVGISSKLRNDTNSISDNISDSSSGSSIEIRVESNSNSTSSPNLASTTNARSDVDSNSSFGSKSEAKSPFGDPEAAQQYVENYLKAAAQNLISVRNGRVVKMKKTDTYTHTTLYLDKAIQPRLERYLKQTGIDKSPFINVAISFLLDHLSVK